MPSPPTGTRHREGRSRPPVACTVDAATAVPWLFAELSPGDAASARQYAGCRGYAIAKGRFASEEITEDGDVGVVIARGHLSRTVTVASGATTEVVGFGDVRALGIVPSGPRGEVTWLALSDTLVVVITRDWLRSMGRWPGVQLAFTSALAKTLAHATIGRAVRECSTIDERLLLTLNYLAARWGEECGEGTSIEIEGLTHEVLAAVTGSRRATITAAMNRLEAQGEIKRRVDRRWVLLGV